MPKTIKDSMFVAIRLGIPFVWVNRYCIDQENPVEKSDIIQEMDQMSSGATMTTIAAAGQDPYHSLRGI